METKKAIIKRQEQQTFLVLEGNNENFEIVLTEDNPNNIKNVFNNLIKDLKRGIFKFELNDDKPDMYHHICEEYLKQLNSEIETIYSDLQEYELVETDDIQEDDSLI
jgi:hypothetical protein